MVLMAEVRCGRTTSTFATLNTETKTTLSGGHNEHYQGSVLCGRTSQLKYGSDNDFLMRMRLHLTFVTWHVQKYRGLVWCLLGITVARLLCQAPLCSYSCVSPERSRNGAQRLPRPGDDQRCEKPCCRAQNPQNVDLYPVSVLAS